MTANTLTVAALQLGSDNRGTQATLENILSYKDQIRDTGCKLVVMPEALLGGYPKGQDFGARIGYRTQQGRDDYLAYWQQAITTDGPEVKALCALAKDTCCNLVVGAIEKAGTSLYCSVLYLSDQGELVGKHRKLMPTASERLVWAQGDGSTLPVLDTSAGRISGAICWENYMPALRQSLYAQGVEIWCVSTVDDREIWQASMRHIAYEGRMFLISACQYQPSPEEQGINTEWPDQQTLIRGGSVIISPMGDILAGPVCEQEGLITAEINLNEIVKARYDLDVSGHYARNDIFQLTVDARSKPGVSFNEQ
ncbi:carbon-nitrogen hydrolase family protein [Oceanospirillum sp. D5]|uniref:Carbon-nitrogen hydrolase family protein n=2 Tax=Oceanospirillum sediminis TaxID=2760088 RepID=A0A839IU66_9GAMM|nr:carbon-nitrogen hydrolase family protein [Oceanospirillum sediminis]